MISRAIIISALFFLSLATAISQEHFPVKGYVFNIENNQPVTNASIVVTTTRQGTSSDASGYFEFMLPAGRYELSVTSVGFSGETIKFSVPVSELLEVRLVPGHMDIEGVDIVGRRLFADMDTTIRRETLSILPSITRISFEEIEKQGAVTLTDAFRYVPGGWTESRGRKTKQFFSVRGQKYPYPDYSVNGIWQKEFEETVYFFSALDIESIEIVRSSSALVKGLTGISGLVDVKTRRPQRETISAMAKYGEQNNYVTNFSYGNKINDLSFNSSLALFGTDGPAGRNGQERIANLHGSADWQVNNKVLLNAGATYIGGLRQLVSIEEGIGAPNIASRQEKFDPIRTLISYAKINYSGDDGSTTELQTNLSYRDLSYTNFNLNNETTSEHTELDYEYGLNVLHSRPLSRTNTLRVGALYNHWVAPEGKRYYVGRAANVHTWSGVVASEQRAGRFVFDGGLRLISGYIVEFGGFGIEGSAAGLRNVEPIRDQAAPLEWQSVFGTTFISSPETSIHYNFAGGSIAPRRGSINEQGSLPGNEARFQHDLGFRYRCENLNELSVSVFYAQRRDALELSGQTVVTDGDFLVELYHNLDKRNYGVEFTTRFNMPALASLLFANATFMKGENRIDGGYEKDEKMPNTILNFGIQYDNSGLDANLFVHYTGPYINNRFVSGQWIAQHGDFPLGDFFSLNFTAGYTFQGRTSTRVFAEMKNLLDERFMTVGGYPDMGRLVSLGLRINL